MCPRTIPTGALMQVTRPAREHTNDAMAKPFVPGAAP
jgi:hypothetical protein